MLSQMRSAAAAAALARGPLVRRAFAAKATDPRSEEEEKKREQPAAAGEAISDELSPALVQFMRSGFLRATTELASAVMQETWDKHGRRAAQVAAIAEFEALCVEQGLLRRGRSNEQAKDGPQGSSTPAVTYQQLSQLYADPSALHVIEEGSAGRKIRHQFAFAVVGAPQDDELRSRLRSMITSVTACRHREALQDAIRRSDEMAKLLKEGPGSLAGALAQLLPKWALGPFAPKS